MFNPLNLKPEFFLINYSLICLSIINNIFLIYLIITQTKSRIGTYKYLMLAFGVYDIVYSTIFGSLKVVSTNHGILETICSEIV